MTRTPVLIAASKVKTIYSGAQSAAADKLAVAFCFAAIGFLLSGSLVHINRVRLQVASLTAIDPNEPLISGTGFASNAVYPTTPLPSVHGNLEFYGSWLGSNTPTGSVYSPWYPALSEFYVFVAGYPDHPGNQLFAEIETAHSGIVRLSVSPHDEPAESWRRTKVTLRGVQEPVKFRIVAVDGSTTFWLGFSQPFRLRSPDRLRLVKQLLLVILTTAASIVLFLSPGLILRQKLLRSPGRYLAFIWIPAPGLIGLALLGLASWTGPHELAARSISRAGVSLVVLYATYQFVRVPLSSFTTVMERRVLLVLVALTAIAVAKTTYSIGPAGELYGGSISRSLEVGERSDSRIPFIIVQLVALRLGPYSDLSTSFHGDWSFSSRGPIAGLAASPIVLASPVQISPTLPDQPWAVFDPEGFSAYRIAMMVMASCSLLAVFGLATVFLSEQWAFFAFLTAGTAPFVIHEIYFTWPKLQSASFVLLAAYLIFQSRYLMAGLSLGIGYLCHPSALFWVPSLLVMSFLSPSHVWRKTITLSRKIYLWGLGSLRILVGVAFCLILWRLINGKHFAQGRFFTFFAMVGGGPVTLSSWLQYRFNSLLNTLVPLNLFIFHRTEAGLHSIFGPSPPVIPFFFQYWNTLPFGVGIAFFFCLLRLMYVAFRKERPWLLYVFVAPFLLFTIYMGWLSKGSLRDGLHAWFLGLMIFAVVIWKKYLAHSGRFWQLCKWAVLFRGVEILLMLLLPSISTQGMLLQTLSAPTDILSLLIMVLVTAWLCSYTFRCADKLRTQNAEAREGTE